MSEKEPTNKIECDHKGFIVGVGLNTLLLDQVLLILSSSVCSNCGAFRNNLERKTLEQIGLKTIPINLPNLKMKGFRA